MVERGEWLTPHAPDELQLNKPPLTYWLIGISYKLFGASYGAARLPSVLAALGVLTIVYLLGAWLGGNRSGLISAAILASSYLFLSFARLAMSDMVLTFCVTAAFACFVVTLTDPAGRVRYLIFLGYVALALGVLAKGPIALVTVALPIALCLIWRRDRAGLNRLRLIPGLGIVLLITSPYFLLVYARFGAGPLRFFFIGENFQRFTGQIYEGGARPFWFEVAAFFIDFAPWSLLIPLAIWNDWRQPAKEERRTARLLQYLLLGCTVVLFSLASFKRDYYLLPAMPVAALIVGPLLTKAEELSGLARRTLQLFLVLCSSAVLAAAIASLKAAAILSAPAVLRWLPPAIALLGFAVLIVCLVTRRIQVAASVLMITMWATILSLQLILLPAFTRYLPATQLAAAVAPGQTVYTSYAASDWANSLAFNLPAPHRVERIRGELNNQKLNDENLLSALNNDQRAIAVIWEREYESLAKQDPSLKILGQAESYGHGGLSMALLRNPRRDHLLLIVHER